MIGGSERRKLRGAFEQFSEKSDLNLAENFPDMDEECRIFVTRKKSIFKSFLKLLSFPESI